MGALQQQVNLKLLDKKQPLISINKEDGLLRHKPLIDYLLGNAYLDETSQQLLSYLYQQFKNDHRTDELESKLIERISSTLEKVSFSKTTSKKFTNSKNPFLDSNEISTKADFMTLQPTFANYINLDCIKLPEKSSHDQQKTTQTVSIGKLQFKSSQQQCSPVASLDSNEGTLSDNHSCTSSGVSSTNTVPVGTGSAKEHSGSNHSPLSSTSSQDSSTSGMSSNSGAAATKASIAAAATLERRRKVRPITELSVVDLLSVADEQMPTAMRSSVGNPSDGFDQLVSHFEMNKQQLNQQQQQQKFNISGGHKIASTKQESFFFELSQRLPKQQRPQLEPLGGLATVSTGLAQQQQHRIITDHYSTVNKARNKQPVAQQVADDAKAAAAAKQFFAITSPLLSCQMVAEVPSSQHPMRATSSLSVLAPAEQQQQSGATDSTSGLHPSFSTSSLGPSARPASAMAQQPPTDCWPATDNSQLLQMAAQQQQKPLTKPAKSVSFDPTVKDPPSSSNSMTLGRASALKSALKSTSWAQPASMQHLMQAQDAFLLQSSSATMPHSMAQQFKATSAAYNAYYDEHGRRVKLSQIMNQQPPLMLGPDVNLPGFIQTVDQLDSSPASSEKKSLLSKLNPLQALNQSSRGGRREMRQQQQHVQPGNQLIIQTQPMPNLSHQQLFVQPLMDSQQQQPQPSTSGLQQQLSQNSRVRATRQRKHKPSRHLRSSRRRSHSSSRKTSSSSRSHHASRSSSSRRGGKNRSKHQCRRDDDDCYDSDADNSSRCSTCSSSDSDDYDSYTSDSDTESYSCNSSCSEDHYGDTTSVSSYSSYASYTSTDSSTSCSSYDRSYDSESTTSSDEKSNDDESRPSSPNHLNISAKESPLTKTAGSPGSSKKPSNKYPKQKDSEAKRRTSSSRREREQRKRRRSKSAGRRNDTRERSSSSKRRSDRRRRRRRSEREGRRRRSSNSSSSTHRSSNSSSSRRARRSAGSSASSSRHHHRRPSLTNVAYVLPTDQQQQAPPVNYYIPPGQHQLHPANMDQMSSSSPLIRAKSPSTMSTDSKTLVQHQQQANNENCRII